jgi:hypothetical protein
MVDEFWCSLNTNISDFNPSISLHSFSKNTDLLSTAVSTKWTNQCTDW